MESEGYIEAAGSAIGMADWVEDEVNNHVHCKPLQVCSPSHLKQSKKHGARP